MRFKIKKSHGLKLLTKNKFPVIFVFVLTSVFLSSYVYNSVFPKKGIAILISESKSNINITVSETINNYLTENKAEQLEFITSQLDNNGKVIGFSANSSKIETARKEITKELSNKLKHSNKVKVKIPIGSLLGSNFLSGKGFNIPLSGNVIYSVSSTVFTELESLGINQSLYKMYIEFTVEGKLLISGETQSYKICEKHLLAERLIFGDVPLS